MKVQSKMLYVAAVLILGISLIFMMGNATAYVGDGATPAPNSDPGATDNRYTATGAPTNTCLNCHASGSIDKSSYLKTGHRNMMRKVTTGGYTNWGDAAGQTYVRGTARGERGLPGIIHWTPNGGTIDSPGQCKDLTYTNQADCLAAKSVWYPEILGDPIYYVTMDWFAPPLRSTTAQGINQVGVTSSKYPTYPFVEPEPMAVILHKNITSTQNCVPCHTTGNAWGGYSYNAPFTPGTPPYTPTNRPAPVNTGAAPEPMASFGSNLSGIIQPASDGPLKEATWYGDGVQCERCHGEAVTKTDMTQGAGSSHHGGPKFKNSDVQGGDGFVFRSGDGLQICLNCHAVPTVTNGVATLANTLSKPSGGFLNSPHARYSGNLYTAPAVGADTIPYYSQGWPWASSPLTNKGASGFRGDFSNPTKFNSKFNDQTYSITTPRIRYTNANDCTPQIRCQTNSALATVREYYEIPTCEMVNGSPVKVAKEVVAPGTVTDPATQTDSITLPNFTCSADSTTATLTSGTTTYKAAKSSTYGQNKGCTGCHDVHGSVKAVTGTNGFKAECAGCHTAGPESDPGAPQVDLGLIMHSSGTGTPLEDAVDNPSESCVICHMPRMNGSKLHVFRINTDPAYSIVNVSTPSTTPNATAPDSTGYTSVWVDVDFACGQCHGGGIDGSGATVLPMTKIQLAAYANGMHSALSPNAAPVIGDASPITVSGMTATLIDNSTCTQHAQSQLEVTVNWGDWSISKGHGGQAFTHTYNRKGKFKITHTVKEPDGLKDGHKERVIIK